MRKTLLVAFAQTAVLVATVGGGQAQQAGNGLLNLQNNQAVLNQTIDACRLQNPAVKSRSCGNGTQPDRRNGNVTQGGNRRPG